MRLEVRHCFWFSCYCYSQNRLFTFPQMLRKKFLSRCISKKNDTSITFFFNKQRHLPTISATMKQIHSEHAMISFLLALLFILVSLSWWQWLSAETNDVFIHYTKFIKSNIINPIYLPDTSPDKLTSFIRNYIWEFGEVGLFYQIHLYIHWSSDINLTSTISIFPYVPNSVL